MTDKTNKPFIITMDKSIADTLMQNGFTLMSDSNVNYIFLNNSTLKFDKDEDRKEFATKIAYTNMLCI